MGTYIKFIITLIVIYCLILLGLPWAKYTIYKSAAERIMLNEEKLPKSKVISSLLTEAEDLKIPLKKEDIKFIEDYADKITTVVEYTEIVNFPVINKQVEYKFKIEKERPLKGENSGY
jgi:hypothetical protein